jgi:hypothetical protein
VIFVPDIIAEPQQPVDFVVRRKEKGQSQEVGGAVGRIPSGPFAGQPFYSVQLCVPDPSFHAYHCFQLRFSGSHDLIAADYLLQ